MTVAEITLDHSTKETQYTKEVPADDMAELEASMKRLEAAGVNVAVWEDGGMRIVVTEADTVAAIDEGGVIYSPKDMFVYINLSAKERRMLHEFKGRFGGSVEWKDHTGTAI